MVNSPRTCLMLHAEKLHEDPVWRATEQLVAQVERRSGHLSLLVYPLRADLAGVDLAERLNELAERGHEIGQHTHFYDAELVQSAGIGKKRTLLTEDNIRRCLDRDFDYLLAAGHRPRGFVSGAWAIHAAVTPWLGERGFRYDSSYRTYKLPYEDPEAAAGDSTTAPFRQGGILQLPTTGGVKAGLRAEVLRRPNGLSIGSLSYRLYYLHDYDLLSPAVRWSARVLARAIGAARLRTGGELAHELSQVVDA